MNNSHKFIEPSVTNYLIQAQEEFTLLMPDSEEGIAASEWLESNFPIVSWGRIDWNAVRESSLKTWDDFPELLSTFEKLVSENISKNKLSNSVVVLWGNASTPGLRIKLSVFLKHLEAMLEEYSEAWVYSEEDKWCIEVYHEGEICFGSASNLGESTSALSS